MLDQLLTLLIQVHCSLLARQSARDVLLGMSHCSPIVDQGNDVVVGCRCCFCGHGRYRGLPTIQLWRSELDLFSSGIHFY